MKILEKKHLNILQKLYSLDFRFQSDGLWVGVKLATQVGKPIDRIVSYFSAVSYAMPAWWAGILMILIFAFELRLLPAGGLYSTPPPEGGLLRFLDLLWHSVLPKLNDEILKMLEQ